MNDDDLTRKLTGDEQRAEFVSSALRALAHEAEDGCLPGLVEVAVWARHADEWDREGTGDRSIGAIMLRPVGGRAVKGEKLMAEHLPRLVVRQGAFEAVAELMLVLARRTGRSDEWEK